MHKSFSLLITLFFALSLQAQTIDETNSKVSFEISNLKFNTVEGTFAGMQGNIEFDESNLALCSFNVCIDAKTVDTDSPKRDEHLQNEDFFEVEKYPNICIVSRQIDKTNSGYLLQGELTMHGVTKAIEIPFVYNNGTFTGDLTLSRYDYGIGADTGTFMVGESVAIKIACKIR